MSFNDDLDNVNILNFAIFLVVSFLILHVSGKYFDFVNEDMVYVPVVFYFMVLFRNSFHEVKQDVSNVFSHISFKNILMIVLLNIFFSYGMLYLSQFLIDSFPSLNFSVHFPVVSMSLVDSLPIIGTFISTVFISPVCEELIFRGILLNKLKLITPTVFAIFISSLLFGSLHSFGSMVSAFVFGVCMAILYLKTENIFVPIFAHFLNNFLAELIKFFDYADLLFTNDVVMDIVAVLSFVSFAVLLSYFVKELNRIK